MTSCRLFFTLFAALAGLASVAGVHGAAPPPGANGAVAEVVVVVSRDSGLSRLSRNQVADLFLGRAVQFPDGRRAVPVDQAEGSAVREAFNDSILERTAAQVRAHWAKIIFTGRGRPPRDVADGERVIQLIAHDPSAIGYIDRSLVDERVIVVALE